MRIPYFLIPTILVSLNLPAFAAPPRTVEEQAAWEANFDIKNIRHLGNIAITVKSDAFLAVPPDYSDWHDFTVAKTAPVVEFSIVQNLEPEYLPWALAKEAGGNWGGWGDVTRGPDGCFYFSISNHLSYGAGTYVIRYDPVTRRQEIALDARDLCDWRPDQFADGKIHGDIDFGPGGETWMLTYFGPVPKPEDWATTYRGGWLLRYNCFTGEKENLGIPLEGASWPYHNYDWQHGLFFAVDHSGGNVLAYDTVERRLLYGGAPPDGIKWYARCVLVDSPTGAVYTTDTASPDKQIVRYTRRNNTFARMNARTPVNPATGNHGSLRAHTSVRDSEQAYWCLDHWGGMFRFFPDADSTVWVDHNWSPDGTYTANIEMSPGGRYIYYIPGQLSEIPKGTPVVQYDTKTGNRKVLAFIFDHFMDEYGYAPIRCYGLELDAKGESLFFYANGGFADPADENPYAIRMRRAALFHLHIPDSEREE